MKRFLLILIILTSINTYAQDIYEKGDGVYMFEWRKGTAGWAATSENIKKAKQKVAAYAKQKNASAKIIEINTTYSSMKRPEILIDFRLFYETTITPNLSVTKLDLNSEKSIIKYFDDKSTTLIEGIWEVSSNNYSYKIAIIKEDFKFVGYIIESSSKWKTGERKVTFETAATDEIVTINWVLNDKRTTKKTVGTITSNNALIDFDLGAGPVQLYRVYPKLGKKKKPKTGEWAGNGSGIIISKSGYIVTNHHVIENIDDIEVEFIIDGEVKKFNAEIVQSDKVNDLAIIKIFDMNFDGLDNLPYNFKTRSSDVGTKVYAYGYPMALSVMGKEIKVTDGIISSKTGFDGNITTYQISAPIQAGNSGGPLFDDKGNFLGINSSGLKKDVADNVGYTIKSSYVLNLLDVLPKSIDLPSSTKLQSLPLTEQIKEISKYVVLVKVK